MLMDRLANYNPNVLYANGEKQRLLFTMVNIVFEGQTFYTPSILYLCRNTDVPQVDNVTFIVCGDFNLHDCKSHVISLEYPHSPEQLFSEICSYFSFYLDWSEKIDTEIYKGASLQYILDLSADLLQNPCILLDDSFNCLALSHDIEEKDILYYDIKVNGKPTSETILILSKNNLKRQFNYGHFDSGIPYRIAEGPSNSPELFIDFKSKGNLVLAMNLRFSHTDLSDGLIDSIGIFAEKMQAYCTIHKFSQLNTGLISMNE